MDLGRWAPLRAAIIIHLVTWFWTTAEIAAREAVSILFAASPVAMLIFSVVTASYAAGVGYVVLHASGQHVAASTSQWIQNALAFLHEPSLRRTYLQALVGATIV